MLENYGLCLEVLKRLEKANILKHVIIIGNWCLTFYKEYFFPKDNLRSLKTGDIDILVPLPPAFPQKTDIPKLLEDLGFVTSHNHAGGYISLDHLDLTIEFLVPERGKGLTKPYDLKELGVNAQALRFLDYLTKDTVLIPIKVKSDKIQARFPHPIRFALHKILISSRPDRKKNKRERDLESGIEILNIYKTRGESEEIKKRFRDMHKNWQNDIKKVLNKNKQEDLLAIFS